MNDRAQYFCLFTYEIISTSVKVHRYEKYYLKLVKSSFESYTSFHHSFNDLFIRALHMYQSIEFSLIMKMRQL